MHLSWDILLETDLVLPTGDALPERLKSRFASLAALGKTGHLRLDLHFAYSPEMPPLIYSPAMNLFFVINEAWGCALIFLTALCQVITVNIVLNH